MDAIIDGYSKSPTVSEGGVLTIADEMTYHQGRLDHAVRWEYIDDLGTGVSLTSYYCKTVQLRRDGHLHQE